MNDLPVVDSPDKPFTREDVESIFHTQLSGLVRQEVTEGLRIALVNIPTLDVVQRMIDNTVRPLRENTTTQLNSVDHHLRAAESRMSEVADVARQHSERFQQTALDISTNVGRLVSELNAQKERLDRFENRQSDVEQQAFLDRTELTKAIGRIDDLHADIHGDPKEPHHVSLHQLIANGNTDRDRNHQELLDSIKPLADRLDTAEKYIASRRGLELQVMQGAVKVLQNKWTTVVFILGMGTILGLNIFQLLQVIFR